MGLDIKAKNFLIPQGYVESFALQMPKDLTAMFEAISNSNAYKADYERYKFCYLLTDGTSFAVRFDKFTRFLCYDRLKLKLFQAGEEVFYTNQKKKQMLLERESAMMEKVEKEKYIKLEKQCVCHIYFQTITIFRNYYLIYIFLHCDKIIIDHYRINKNLNFN